MSQQRASENNVRPPRHALQVGTDTFPFLRTVEMAEAVATLAEYVEEAQAGPIVVTNRGRPIAVLARVSGVDLEDLSIGTDPDFMRLIERSRAGARQGGTIPFEEVCRGRAGRPSARRQKAAVPRKQR